MDELELIGNLLLILGRLSMEGLLAAGRAVFKLCPRL